MRKSIFLVLAILLFIPSHLSPSNALAENSCLTLGSQQYLEANSRLIPLASDFTIEFDFYLSKDTKSYAEIISQGGQPNSFYIGINPDLGIRAGDTWIETGAKMPLKKWVHIALTHSVTDKGTLYIDGKLFASIDRYTLNNAGTATRVGAQYDPSAGERINGCIDNLMIWKSVRTSSEIGQDYLLENAVTNANLIAFYDFNTVSSEGLIQDSSGASNQLRPLNPPELLPVSDPAPDYVLEFNYGGALRGSNSADGGPSYYVTADLKNPFPSDFRSGFGWYSTAWSISSSQIDNFQLGLSSTWIVPDNPTIGANISQKLCDTGTNDWVKNAASDPKNGTYGLFLFQTIEGSLGWWGGEKFRTVFPKYMANVTQNCYTSELATPGWGFFRDVPTERSATGLIQISNQILMPPDGMTFEEDNSAPQLGVTWHALNLPRFDRAFGSKAGDNSWTLFMNTSNFKGPIAFVAPQFWVDGSLTNSLQNNLTLDKRPGATGGLASEWASIPYFKYTDSAGKIYTKIPEIQFPVDSNGDFAISRDFKSYSNKAISSDLRSTLLGSATLPLAPISQEIASGVLVGNAPSVFQDGKTLANVSSTLAAKNFDNGNAYGFSAPGKIGMIKLPQYFLEANSIKNEINESEAPKALAKSVFTNPDKKSTFVYQYPSWWDASPKASEDLTTQLNDGSVVVYRWYKFVDQPALQRFELNESEKANLQSAVIKMQKDWANSPMMANPSKGKLVSFDAGILASPPKGLEYGYVPIVIKQYMGSGLIKVTPTPTPTATPSSSATPKATAEANAAAEAKKKEIEEAMAAAARAAADLKAKQEADAKAAAELKAKQEADAKAAAEKLISDAKAEAARILAEANAQAKAAAAKKATITCTKGKLIKKVTAVKPVCPKGYKKKK